MFEQVKFKGRIVLLVAVLIECILHYDMKNIYGCVVALYGWWLFENVVFKRNNFKTHFIPTLAVAGYIIMYFFLPIIVTLIENKPLTFNFENPFLLWNNMLINISVIVAAYYLNLQINNNILTGLWERIGFFKAPTQRQIMFIGVIGLIAILFNVFIQTNQGDFDDMQKNATGGFSFQIVKILEGYAFIPLCLLFPDLYNYKRSVVKWPALVFLGVIIIVSIASTRRSLIFLPIFSIFLLFIYYSLLKNKVLISKKKFFISVVTFFVLSGPITDLAAAMSLNRHNLNSLSTFESVIKLYNDKERLHSMYQALSAFAGKGDNNNEGWSEYYVDNIFLDRFCNLRVQDATLFYANHLGYDFEGMHEFAKDFIIIRLPTFVTNALGEKKISRTSPADYMTETYFHYRNHFLGQRVGGDIGIGLCWLGYKYYFVSFIIYFVVFFFLSSLTLARLSKTVIPVYVMAKSASYFMYFSNSIGIFSSINLLMRDGVQNIVIYCVILFFVTRIIK